MNSKRVSTCDHQRIPETNSIMITERKKVIRRHEIEIPKEKEIDW